MLSQITAIRTNMQISQKLHSNPTGFSAAHSMIEKKPSTYLKSDEMPDFSFTSMAETNKRTLTMVLPASVLLMTFVGCSASSTQAPQLSAVLPQLETAPLLNVPTQQLIRTNGRHLLAPEAPIEVEWSARSRESSLGAVLQLGSQGAVVTRLQARLARLGYAVDNIDGIFGPQTQAKVMQFQQATGLAPDGIVGASVWAKLNHDIAHSGESQQSQPIQPSVPVAIPASSLPIAPLASPAVFSPITTPSVKDDLPSSQNTGLIIALIVLQGFGWLVILQALNKELALLTGRSLFPSKTK
jgi:peptidoglycan hydrolase-like protein with peptidoglycan-binding domain